MNHNPLVLCRPLLLFLLLSIQFGVAKSSYGNSITNLSPHPSGKMTPFTCSSLFKPFNRGFHKPSVTKAVLTESDLNLWRASNEGDHEVGILELLDIDGKILRQSEFIMEASSGNIIKHNMHVPIQKSYQQLVSHLAEFPSAAVVRFTHVHPKVWTSKKVLNIGPIWIFSPGEIDASFKMKLMLEMSGFSHLTLEMGLVYQPPFHSTPQKKQYLLDSNLNWIDGDYSLGYENDSRLEKTLNRQRSRPAFAKSGFQDPKR